MEPHEQKLVDENLGLAVRVAQKYFRNLPTYPVGERVSTASIGLCVAAQGYDPDRGVKFSTYAWKVMYGSLADEYRRLTNRLNVSGQATEVVHPPDRSDSIGAIDAREQWEHIKGYLSDMEIQYLMDYHVEGMTMREMGAERGCTKSNVSLILRRIERNIREATR